MNEPGLASVCLGIKVWLTQIAYWRLFSVILWQVVFIWVLTL